MITMATASFSTTSRGETTREILDYEVVIVKTDELADA
jgi:hypothetical protein